MKHESQNPIKVEATYANAVAKEIGKNMGYFIQTPKSHLISYEQFSKVASNNAPVTTFEEKKPKL